MALDLAQAARAAEAAADAARREILPRFRKVGVETKSDGSPVTEADRAAERAIRAVLREFDPSIGILGEEFGAEGATEGRHWVVDPIDGTRGFTRGGSFWGPLIALAEGSEVLAGALGLPVLGSRTFGLVELGAAASFADRLWHLVLPSIIAAVTGIASLSRYMRGSMLEVTRQD
ncbi:MAG: inositol monophosphatase family protein, partial [Planctomycetota bacterium]|nr:inositol monophosphatase family protein [Planctomycetota bacterium]